MFEAARLAILICINHTFRSFKDHSVVITTLLTQLVAIVAKIDEYQMMCRMDELERQHVEMMLWVGFVAGIHSTEKSWIGQLLSSAIVFLGLESAKEVEAVLRRYFWTDEMQRSDYVAFWQGAKSDTVSTVQFDEDMTLCSFG